MSADSERRRSTLIAATVLLMLLIVVLGYLSTGLFSLACGIEVGTGYCARLYGGVPVEELYLVLAPAALAGCAGVLGVRRRSPRLPLKAGLGLIPVAVLLPPLLMTVWS